MAEKKVAPAPDVELDELGWIGHVVTALLGITALVAAVFSYRAGIQITLTVSLAVAGALLPLLSWLSMRRSRAAWSFLISMSVVLGIMTLFGAPKVRTLLEINIGVALIFPVLFFGAAFAVWAQYPRYRQA